MTITVGDVLRVVCTLVWTDGQIAQNVFNAVIGGTGGPYDESDIVDDALAWIGVIFANAVTSMSDEIDGSQVQVYVYDSIDDDWDEVGSIGWTFNPSNAADQMPRGVAGLTTSGSSDPDVQGKKYWAGFTENAAVDGLWVAAQLVIFLAMAEDWVTPFTGSVSTADWVPGIWSPTETNFFPSNENILATAIPAYQRRRKQGYGV